MILTHSTWEAISDATRALDGGRSILHIVTDDFQKVVTILDQAFFKTCSPQGADQRYQSLPVFLRDSKNARKEWLNLIKGQSGAPRVIYVAPEDGEALSKTSLDYIMEYQEQWSLSQYDVSYSMNSVLVIYGRKLTLPSVLEPHVARIVLSELKKEDFRKILQHLIQPTKEEMQDKYFCRNLDEMSAWYAAQLAGFPENEVVAILRSFLYAENRKEQQKNLFNKTLAERIIRNEKNRFLDVHGKLDCIPAKSNLAGLEPVQKWLKKRKKNVSRVSFDDDEDLTKGILLLGLPGTGKSLLASCCANILELPLIRLDISNLLGQYVGNSETNMRQALEDLTVAGAPCVLWIDEIDKAYSGVGKEGGGSGVMNRLFGKMLTFMQEMNRTVFLVATANDISALPPELFRSGRFSQVFSLMLPTYEECADIFRSKLKRHLGTLNADHARELFNICAGLKCWSKGKLCDTDSEASRRFLTGADITQAALDLTIELNQLPGQGSSCPTIKKEQLYAAMQTVSEQLRTTVDTHIPLTLERAATSYIKVLEQCAVPANAEDAPICRKNYQPHLVTQKTSADRNAPPQCLKMPETFASYYDQEMFAHIGRAMDTQLRKGK